MEENIADRAVGAGARIRAGAAGSDSDEGRGAGADPLGEQTERRFELLVRSIRDYAIFMLQPDGTVASWNEGAERIKGYAAEEVIGRSFDLFYTAEDRAAGLPAQVLEAARRAGSYQTEGWRVRRDGTAFWGQVTITALRDDAGELIGFAKVTRDLTERRAAEAAQRAAEERVRFLAEAGRQLTSSLDYEETLRRVARLAVPAVADWCVVDVLAGGRIHRLGVAHADPVREALALELASRYPPDVSASHGVAEVLRTSTPQVVTELRPDALRTYARDDEHHSLLQQLGLRSFMILPMIARGRTLGTITFIAAESGRHFSTDDLPFAEELAHGAALAVDNARLFREAEAARQEAERSAREEAALRQATEAVTATFSIDEVIRLIAEKSLEATEADGAFVKRIDLESDEVEVVAAAGSGVPPLGARTAYTGSFTALVVESGQPLALGDPSETEAAARDLIMKACGTCSALVVPLIDAGEAIGALVLTRNPGGPGFGRGETQRACTFADLASLAFRKIHLLRESEQRREELEAVMESRARLLRGFSHDLKNPLGAADGYLELIESGVISDPEKKDLSISRARRSIHSAVNLINDLTELARTESGRIHVRSEPVDVREITLELTEEYRAQAEGKGLAIRCEAPERMPLTESDATRIRQVLGNLVSNAVKYTSEGGIGIAVTERGDGTGPREGSWIAVSIADTGIGIPPEKHNMLFREFMRLEPALSQGAGLGLAISQRVADALGGCITLESEPGRGSVFTLWIPLRAGER